MKALLQTSISCLTLLAVTSKAFASPPPNDMRATATQITGDGRSYSVSNEFATSETGDFPGEQAFRTLWWTWTAPADGLLTLETTGGSGVSSHLVMACHLQGNGSVLGAEISTHSGSSSYLPRTSFPVARGTKYIFGLGVWKSTEFGMVNFSLNLNRTHSVATIPSAHSVTTANDAFANRIRLSGSSTRAIGYNKTATREAAEPVFTGQLHSAIYRSLWWTYRPAQNGVLTVEVNPGGSAARNLSSATFIGSAIQNLSLVRRNESASSGVLTYNMPVTAGIDYQICVGGYTADDPGAVVLSLILDTSSIISTLNIVHPATMTNDLFANRIALTGNSPSVVAYNHNASNEAGEPQNVTPNKNFWWTYRPTTPGELQISSNGGTIPPYVTVFAGTWPNLRVVALGPIGNSAVLKFPVTSGLDYFICAGSQGTVTGSIVLTLSMNVNAEPYAFATYSGPASVSNDLFANAITLTGDTVSAMGYNFQAGNEYRALWWKWTAGASGDVTFDPIGTKKNSGQTLAVTVNILRSGGGDDILGPLPQGGFGFNAVAGTTYYIGIGSSMYQWDGEFGTLFFTLSGSPSIPIVTNPEASFIVRVGEPINLRADATGGSLSYQWYRNGSAINGATSRIYAVASAALSNAGSYYCRVRNNAGSANTGVARVAVLNTSASTLNVVNGGSLVISTQISTPSGGNSPVYQWRKGSTNLSDGGRISGSKSSRLTVSGVDASDASTYTCRVTFDGKTLTTDGVVVTIQGLPTVDTIPPQIWTVAQTVSLSVTSLNAPPRYVATGLPNGISFDRITGRFGGKPTRPGVHTIRIYASSVSSRTWLMDIPVTVSSLPEGVIGTFDGLVARHSVIGKWMGGHVTITVSTTGVLSGTMRLAEKTHRFRSLLDAAPASDPVVSIPIPRAGLAPLEMVLNFDSARQRASGQLDDGIYDTGVRVDRRTWHASSNPATTWAGTYNMTMGVPEALKGDNAFPQGMSYARFTLTTSGAVRMSGRMGEGTPFTLSTQFWRERYIPIHVSMHNDMASLRGLIRINAGGAAPLYPDNRVVDSNLDWMKTGASSSKDRLYRSGFGLMRLTVDGSKWVAPPKGVNAMEQEDTGSQNVNVAFAYGGLGSADRNTINQSFRMDATSRCYFDRTVNQGAVKFSFNKQTGLWSGAFKLQNPNPAGGRDIVRNVTCQGLILQHTHYGHGTFRLPRLPNPSLSPPTTSANSDILGGVVLIRPR